MIVLDPFVLGISFQGYQSSYENKILAALTKSLKNDSVLVTFLHQMEPDKPLVVGRSFGAADCKRIVVL